MKKIKNFITSADTLKEYLTSTNDDCFLNQAALVLMVTGGIYMLLCHTIILIGIIFGALILGLIFGPFM